MQLIPSIYFDWVSNESTVAAADDILLVNAQWSQLKKRRSNRRISQSGATAAAEYGSGCMEEEASSPSCSRQLEPLLKAGSSTPLRPVLETNVDSDLTAEQHLPDLESPISGIDDSDSAAVTARTKVPELFLAKGEIGTVQLPMKWKQPEVEGGEEEDESANELEGLQYFVSVSEVLPPLPPPREFSTHHEEEDIIESNAAGLRKLQNDPELGVMSMSYPQLENSNAKGLQLDFDLMTFHEAEQLRSRGAGCPRKRKREACEGEEWLQLGLRTSTPTPSALENFCSVEVSSSLAGSENHQHRSNSGFQMFEGEKIHPREHEQVPGEDHDSPVHTHIKHLPDFVDPRVAGITGCGGFRSVLGNAGASLFRDDASGSSRDAQQQRNLSYANARIINSPLLDTGDVGMISPGPSSQPNAIWSRIISLRTTTLQSPKTETENAIHLGAREETASAMPRNSAKGPTPRLPCDRVDGDTGNSSQPDTTDPLQLTKGFRQAASLNMQFGRHVLQKTKQLSRQDLWQTLLQSVGSKVQQYKNTDEAAYYPIASSYPPDHKHRKDSRELVNSDPVPRRDRSGDRSGRDLQDDNRPGALVQISRATTSRGDRNRQLWFTLRAAENQTSVLSLLEQIPIVCIRIRNENVTVSSVQKYVASKLGLLSKTEVKISCKGQELGENLRLHHVHDSIWHQPARGNTRDRQHLHCSGTTTGDKFPLASNLDGQLLEGKACIFPDGSVMLTQDVVMVLTYSRHPQTCS